jgi:hypothetical protein
LAFLILLAVAGAAAAQGRTGTITGVVTGDDGNRLPGVTVTVENPSAGVRRTATTDADGRFDISELPADGEYLVGASLVGFAVATPERVTIGTDRRATANFVLKVTLLESVAVTARSPLLEEDQSRVQQTISDQLVHTCRSSGATSCRWPRWPPASRATPTFPIRRARTTRPTTCSWTAPATSRNGEARRGRSIPATASKRSRNCAS